MAALAKKYDVVIVGGGPAGSCTALFLKQMGIQSLIDAGDDGDLQYWPYDVVAGPFLSKEAF